MLKHTLLPSLSLASRPGWFITHTSVLRPISTTTNIKMSSSEHYMFGPYKIHQNEVFYSTQLSYAFVNLRPAVPVKRFVDLTVDETSDLWLTAQKIGSQLECYHKASSLTFTIQIDEKEKELKQKLDLDKERKDRNPEEMSQEADEYRKLF
ncbi:bifunctional bis(5'-adenosyl)-triphosphatase/adenylylsulfatase fhit [Quercus suber]|uniref:Bifunctional bis(5'-adenosyl)-triphosphatase/adenylylsulfatase fhit n=1 Tax=Quercus suber TaxID=58331 RepID=A0AAW0JJD7_QUESU